MSDQGSGVIAEKCEKCGGLKAGHLHKFSSCAMDVINEKTKKNKAQAAEIEYLKRGNQTLENNFNMQAAEIEGYKNRALYADQRITELTLEIEGDT
jgi:molecular chaperone GrpE (heat shock protein)